MKLTPCITRSPSIRHTADRSVRRPHPIRSARGPAALSRQGTAERTDTPRRRTTPPGRGVRTTASVPCGSVVHLEPWRSSAAAQTRPSHRLGIGCVFRSSSLPWHSLTGGFRADSSDRPADRLRRAQDAGRRHRPGPRQARQALSTAGRGRGGAVRVLRRRCTPRGARRSASTGRRRGRPAFPRRRPGRRRGRLPGRGR